MYCKPPKVRGRIVIRKAKSTTHHTNNDAEWLALQAGVASAKEHLVRGYLSACAAFDEGPVKADVRHVVSAAARNALTMPGFL